MAVVITRPSSGIDYKVSNKQVRVRKLVFSGNYATGGESVTAANVGLKVIEQVVVNGGGVAAASALSTGIATAYDFDNSKFVFFEGSAAGTALSEKTNAEAYPTGCFLRVTFIGY